jgi:antirestriction protein
MKTETVTPRVWIGCLAAYNAGRLHGEWVDIPEDADDLREEIARVLKGSPIPGAEEWAFMDLEGVPSGLRHEYADVESLCAYITNLHAAHDERAFYLYCENMDDDTGEGFDDSYVGSYESETDFAYETVMECGLSGVEPGPALESLSTYLDWELIARDLGMDHVMVRDGGSVYVFRSY